MGGGGENWFVLRGRPPEPIQPRMFILAGNPSTIIAVSSRVLYRSKNSGENWTTVRPPTPPFPSPSNFDSIAVDPNDHRTLWVGANRGIYKSIDAGDSWMQVGASPDVPADVANRGIAVEFGTPSTIYAASTGGFFKSVDGGAHWQRIGAFPSSGTFADLDMYPTGTQTIYARMRLGGGFFRSTDGGMTWSNHMPFRITGMSVVPNAPNLLVAASDTGFASSGDSGGSWSFSPVGYVLDQTSSLLIDTRSSETIYVSTISRGVFKSTQGGNGWRGTSIGLPSAFPQAVLAIASDSSVLYAGTSRGLYRSVDAGESWQTFGTGLPAGRTINDLLVDPRDNRIVYAAVPAGGTNSPFAVYKSTDAGATWRAANSVPEPPSVRSLAIDPFNSQVLYAATGLPAAGNPLLGLYRSQDGGLTWQRIGPSLLGVTVDKVTVDPTNPAIIYLSTGLGLFKTINRGESWTVLGAGTTVSFSNDLVIHPTTSSVLYVATEHGVFRSTDGGETWSGLHDGMLTIGAQRIAIIPSNPSVLYISTDRRGVFKSTDGGVSWHPTQF